MNKTMIGLVAFLASTYNEKFEDSNQRAGRTTIPTKESNTFQVRLTKPDAARGQGVRVSVNGTKMGELATSENGFGKLRFHLELGEKIQAHLGDKYVVSYDDTPRGDSAGYPTLYINLKSASVSAGTTFDPSELVSEAVKAGVSQDRIIDAISRGDYTALKAFVSLALAVGGAKAPAVSDETEAETDADGDEIPFK
jgi:hypothetical protein